jgi:hypothetical protein
MLSPSSIKTMELDVFQSVCEDMGFNVLTGDNYWMKVSPSSNSSVGWLLSILTLAERVKGEEHLRKLLFSWIMEDVHPADQIS